MSIDGLYFKHLCKACGREWYDCLPMLVCEHCGADSVSAVFDDKKRAAEIQQREQSQ